jgi:hypothetical protein
MTEPAATAPRTIGRRGLILGTTATAIATSLAVAPSATAAPPAGGGGGTHDGATVPTGGATTQTVKPDSSPITTTIGSAPLGGYVYRSVDMYDFKPFNPAAGLTWGGNGTYSSGVATTIRASMDIPNGALVADVEYYIYNNSGSDFVPDSHLYVPGFGSISSIGASVVIPSNAAGITASRAVVSQKGPYPLGARLMISCATPSNGAIQVNGARVGFLLSGGAIDPWDRPFRAYDSQTSGGKFAANSTRTITLPASIVPPGVVGVSLNVTSLNATANGLLRVYSASTVEPTTSVLYYRGDGFPSTNQIITAVSAARQIKVRCTSPTDVVLDVLGLVG